MSVLKMVNVNPKGMLKFAISLDNHTTTHCVETRMTKTMIDNVKDRREFLSELIDDLYCKILESEEELK